MLFNVKPTNLRNVTFCIAKGGKTRHKRYAFRSQYAMFCITGKISLPHTSGTSPNCHLRIKLRLIGYDGMNVGFLRYLCK